MKIKILAWLYAFAILATPSFAWAQTQPTPVAWANSEMFQHSSVSGVLVDTAKCVTYDLTGYNAITVRVVTGSLTGDPAAIGCNRVYVDFLEPTTSCVVSAPAWVGKAMVNNAMYFGTNESDTNTTTARTFDYSNVATGLGRKLTVRVQYKPSTTPQACTGVAYVQPMVAGGTSIVGGLMDGRMQYGMSAAYRSVAVDYNGNVQVAGPIAAGSSINYVDGVLNPVLIGGSDGTNARTALTNVAGAQVVTGYGGGMTLGAETLVDVAATAMPTNATAKSYTFFNAGTKTIYCGFDNTVTTSTGIPIGANQGATFDLASLNQTLYCITSQLQVAGAGTRTVISTASDTARIYGGGGGGGGGSTSTDYAPGVPSNVSCSANVSCAITGLTASKTYQFGCNADFAYRVGSGTPTAVATDNDAKAGVMYRQMLGTGNTAFAFISSSAATCKVGLVPDS